MPEFEGQGFQATDGVGFDDHTLFLQIDVDPAFLMARRDGRLEGFIVLGQSNGGSRQGPLKALSDDFDATRGFNVVDAFPSIARVTHLCHPTRALQALDARRGRAV